MPLAPTVAGMTTWRPTIATIAPAAAAAVIGATAIALNSEPGRGSTHQFWQSVVLLESTAALLYRRRHPGAALAAILAGYLAFDVLDTAAAALVVALFTVAVVSEPRRAAVATGSALAVVLVAPVLHGDSSASMLTIVVAIGMLLAAALGQAAYARSAPAAAQSRSVT
jgi:hypothetical protein